ncbi:MAG TPA: hypothetical protein VL500_02165 [Candidatus Eisenbacteria bacterium]|jgi:Tfp pilus assembly protein PilE|nr:hypothetical protein [Candidatus Eisenbacteria bacterium]
MKLFTARNDERGFSLMEALTVIGVMTIVLLMVDQIFAVSYDVYVKQSARTENENGATFAARNISELARGAEEVETSHVINSTTYTTSSDLLVLKVPTLDASNNVVANSYDYIAIYRDGTVTTEIWSDTAPAAGSKRASGKKLVTAYNTILKFRFNDPDVTNATRVQMYVVNTQTKRSMTLTTKAWISMFLRNH